MILANATPNAQSQLHDAVQAYANRLAGEAERQELSRRDPGVMYPEVTADSVSRATSSFDKFGKRAKPARIEISSLLGVPIFAGATGVMGSYLNSPVQWAVFSVCVFFAVLCLAHLAVRRML